MLKISGDIFCIKNISPGKYDTSWTSNCGIANAYLHAVTNDLDSNGKKEFWIGGQDFVQGITKLICYESAGDNNYEPVASIQLNINSFMVAYLQARGGPVHRDRRGRGRARGRVHACSAGPHRLGGKSSEAANG